MGDVQGQLASLWCARSSLLETTYPLAHNYPTAKADGAGNEYVRRDYHLGFAFVTQPLEEFL